MKRIGKFFIAAAAAATVALASAAGASDERFTIAVIPDTQNYIDYTHQKAEGFPFDANALFIEQMRYIAANAQSAGGEIAFVTAVGDIWQHQTGRMDPAHAARGFTRVSHPTIDRYFAPSPKTLTIELPTAKAGYALLAGKVPFSVVPGNHDYDAMWPNQSAGDAAAKPTALNLHVGGLDNFRSVFGANSDFFRDKPWYIASHDGGADSAQIFTAGGYRFLHVGLQFAPPNASLEWAASVLRRHPGLPTIVTTHDYMNKHGERLPEAAIDAHAADPQDNSPQMVWDKFISRHPQIFMVLSGHQLGQALRIDDNAAGRKVYQLLADYQGRAQTAKDAGMAVDRMLGIGDGWLRLMRFDMRAATPTVRVRTYSTHFGAFSTATPHYAAWYKADEKPELSDEAFHREDDFVLELTDFRERFDRTARAPAAASQK